LADKILKDTEAARVDRDNIKKSILQKRPREEDSSEEKEEEDFSGKEEPDDSSSFAANLAAEATQSPACSPSAADQSLFTTVCSPSISSSCSPSL
jgi:hypothetical protein